MAIPRGISPNDNNKLSLKQAKNRTTQWATQQKNNAKHLTFFAYNKLQHCKTQHKQQQPTVKPISAAVTFFYFAGCVCVSHTPLVRVKFIRRKYTFLRIHGHILEWMRCAILPGTHIQRAVEFQIKWLSRQEMGSSLIFSLPRALVKHSPQAAAHLHIEHWLEAFWRNLHVRNGYWVEKQMCFDVCACCRRHRPPPVHATCATHFNFSLRTTQKRKHSNADLIVTTTLNTPSYEYTVTSECKRFFSFTFGVCDLYFDCFRNVCGAFNSN